MAAGGGNWDGLGTEAGGRDAAGESRAAAELISAPLPSSSRHPPLPSRAAAPRTPLPCRIGEEGGRGSGSPPNPAFLALRLPPAAPQLCTWAGGGGVCSAALRLSSARGRERELFVPVARRLAVAHRGLAKPGCTGAHRELRHRCSRERRCHRRGIRGTGTPGRGQGDPSAVAGVPLPAWGCCPRGTCRRLVAWRQAARGWPCPPPLWWEPGAGAEPGGPPASC